jgi:hypothetical protein
MEGNQAKGLNLANGAHIRANRRDVIFPNDETRLFAHGPIVKPVILLKSTYPPLSNHTL